MAEELVIGVSVKVADFRIQVDRETTALEIEHPRRAGEMLYRLTSDEVDLNTAEI